MYKTLNAASQSASTARLGQAKCPSPFINNMRAEGILHKLDYIPPLLET
jgi:hypothetical protein